MGFIHTSVWARLWPIGLGLWMTTPWLGGAWAQDLVQLNQQLNEAVAQEKWSEAIQLVDQMIEIEPSWANRLTEYRQQLVIQAGPDLRDLPPPPTASSTTASPATTPETGLASMQNCGSDTECILSAAAVCQPAQGEFRTEAEHLSGLSASGLTHLEIQGQTSEGCRTLSQVDSVTDLDLSAMGLSVAGNDLISEAMLSEFLAGTRTSCLYTSGSALRSVLEVDLGQRMGQISVAQIKSTGGSMLEGPMTLDGLKVADCQISLPNQIGGIPLDFNELF